MAHIVSLQAPGPMIRRTTSDAIKRLEGGVPPLEAGRDDEQSNGNGSLMRILPVALWFTGQGIERTIDAAHRFSAPTHRHPRSQVGCAIFCVIAQRLLAGADANSAAEEAWNDALRHYEAGRFVGELAVYSRIAKPKELEKAGEHEIRGSGYVVDALEASLWCLLTSGNFREAVLKAVNLGEDTDTTGAITGALAGVRYGVDAIPADWRVKLARHGDLDKLFNAFAARVGEPGFLRAAVIVEIAVHGRPAMPQAPLPVDLSSGARGTSGRIQ